jgi:GNAT superfamily N-acetyltransferase
VSWRIVPGTEIGDLVRLQPVAEQAFGVGDRRPEWFTDKLDRECIDPALTQVALHGDDPIGYVLVGSPPSCAPALRAAGTAVLRAWRGRGIASALLDAVSEAAAGEPLELWAQDEVTPFYVARGFVL